MILATVDDRHAALRWGDNGAPYSTVFEDKYFCTDNGYEEAVHVCCRGNRLDERFTALDPVAPGTFTIIETGFGTGLDFCCAWQMWDALAPCSWKLHFISLERYPLSSEELSRALGLWPSLLRNKEALVGQYAPLPGGVGRMSFDSDRVSLTIAFDDVVRALGSIKDLRLAPQGADAWFLDGFAPFKNPGMWSDEVFAGMAALSRSGTTLSTFTVAGAVRRGLEKYGFSVEKTPGHGKKKHILTGTFQGKKG